MGVERTLRFGVALKAAGGAAARVGVERICGVFMDVGVLKELPLEGVADIFTGVLLALVMRVGVLFGALRCCRRSEAAVGRSTDEGAAP